MPGWAKALLIIGTAVLLLIVLVVGAGVFWWTQNKDALKARAKEAAADGREFGKRSDNQGCVDETMARYKKEQGFFSALKYQRFMDGCLATSRPTPEFCDGLPLGNMMKMAAWQDALCQRYDLANDRNCKQLSMPVVMFCGAKKRSES